MIVKKYKGYSNKSPFICGYELTHIRRSQNQGSWVVDVEVEGNIHCSCSFEQFHILVSQRYVNR